MASNTPDSERLKTWSFDAFVVGISVAGNGRTFGVALGDGTVRIVDAEAPEPAPITVHNGACLSFAPDATPDAFLSGGDDGKLVRINANGELTTLAETKGKWVEQVTAHAGANVRVYAIGKDAYVLDVKGKKEPRKISHPTTVGGLAINAKGKRLAASHYNGVSLWWLATQDSKPQELDWKGSHLAVTWSPDGDYLITEMQENALHGWRMSDGQHMRMSGYGAKVRSMSFSRRGVVLATGGADTVICWPFSGGGPMGKAPLEFGSGPMNVSDGSPVTAVSCNPKRDVIAAGFANGALVLGNPGVRSVAISGARKAPVPAMAWNAAGDRLLVGDEAGEVVLVDFRE